MNDYFFKKTLFLKTPNIELPESEIKVGVESSRPLKCDYLSRVTNIKGITVHISRLDCSSQVNFQFQCYFLCSFASNIEI